VQKANCLSTSVPVVTRSYLKNRLCVCERRGLVANSRPEARRSTPVAVILDRLERLELWTESALLLHLEAQGGAEMDAQIRAILSRAGISTHLDDDDLQAIASSVSSSGLSAASPAPSDSHAHSTVNASSADLSLASEVLRTLRSPQGPLGAQASPPPRSQQDANSRGGRGFSGLPDALRRE
jgi:hypothetical protein